MASSSTLTLTLILLFSLALFSGITEARDFPGRRAVPADSKLKQEKSFIRDLEPIPNLSSYGGDDCNEGQGHDYKKSFVKDLELKSSSSATAEYGEDDHDKSFLKDFEPRSNILIYTHGDDSKPKKDEREKDFEARPSATAYGDNSKPSATA